MTVEANITNVPLTSPDILREFLKPIFAFKALKAGAHTRPPIPVPEVMIPRASPLLALYHGGATVIVGYRRNKCRNRGVSLVTVRIARADD